MKKSIIVGTTGYARAGKSEALKHLRDVYGFAVVSPSHMIQMELRRIHGDRDFSRDEMREMGTALKQLHGPAFAVHMAAQSGEDRVSIDGIRNLAAARALEALGGHMLGFVADAGVRYERAKGAGDGKQLPPDLEAFVAQEAPEMDSADPYGMQIVRVLGAIPVGNIIDTTHLTVREANRALDIRLGALGIAPILSTYDAA